MALFSQMLGIGWKNHVVQVATGFAGYSVVVLLFELLHRFTGATNDSGYHFQEQCRISAGSFCTVLLKLLPGEEFSLKWQVLWYP